MAEKNYGQFVMRTIQILFSFILKIIVLAIGISAIFILGDKALSFAWLAIFAIWMGFVFYFLRRKRANRH